MFEILGYSCYIPKYLGPLFFKNVTEESRHGLASVFSIPCFLCGHLNKIESSEKHRSGKRGPMTFDINTRAALGCLHAGIGESHMNNFLSTMNIPTLNSLTFKTREREVGGAVENIVKNSCQEFINKLKADTLNNGIKYDEDNLLPVSCSFDMGWQKRGKGHNSLTGQAATMSLTSGKILYYTTRVKTSCRFCDYAKKNYIKAKPHDCRRNHADSSNAREPSAAVQLFNKAPQKT